MRKIFTRVTSIGLTMGMISCSTSETLQSEYEDALPRAPTFPLAQSLPNVMAACPQLHENNIDLATVSFDIDHLEYHPDFKIVSHANIQGEITAPSPATMKKILSNISKLESNDAQFIEINSLGGHYSSAKHIVDAMKSKKTKGHFITMTSNSSAYAASSASMILTGGSYGYRFMHADATVILHAVRDKINNGEHIKFSEDYPTGSSERKNLNDINRNLRNYYRSRSANDSIPKGCINEIIKGKQDVRVSSLDMLKSGLVDGVFIDEFTMAVRLDDPRTETDNAHIPLETNFKRPHFLNNLRPALTATAKFTTLKPL